MKEDEIRARVVTEAKSWLGTPYLSNALVKGPRGGTDCAMLLLGVYRAAGLIGRDFVPPEYSPQWHLHRNEEMYMLVVKQFAREVSGPPERMPKPGDVVMFTMGRLLAHAAIVIDWPYVIHAVGGSKVRLDDISKNTTGKRALALVPKRFFSLWS